MLFAVLANIKRSHVEPEQFHLANQLRNKRIGYIIRVVMAQTTVNDAQILHEFYRIAITRRSVSCRLVHHIMQALEHVD